jgi:type I restriction enzyme S subunit
VNENWKNKRLKEICSLFTDGDWIVSNNQAPDGIRLIQTGNIGEGEFRNKDNHRRYISEEKFSELNCTEVFQGDCLISRLPDPVGRACLIPDLKGRMITVVDCTIIRFYDHEIVPKYFVYFSQTKQYQDQIEKLTTGTTRKRISRKNLGNVFVPIPPLSEQQRIVALLDQVFTNIDIIKKNYKKNLQNIHELHNNFKSKILSNQDNDWIKCELGKYVRFIDYRGRTPPKKEQGIRLITAKNIKMGYIQKKPEEFIDPSIYDSWMTRGLPKTGDVLFTTEAPLANIAQLDTDEKVAFAQRVIILQPDCNKIDNTFLKYLLMSEHVQRKIKQNGTGATVIGIKARLLKKIEISFPNSIEEQKEIVKKISNLECQINELESYQKQKLLLLEELGQSILNKLFL